MTKKELKKEQKRLESEAYNYGFFTRRRMLKQAKQLKAKRMMMKYLGYKSTNDIPPDYSVGY